MKKFLVFGVLFTLFLGVVPVQAAEVTSFSDVSEMHLNKGAIDVLKADNVIEGYGSGEYKPDNTINRAEFAKILVETFFPGEAEGSECFPDVHDEWFAKYVCFAKEKDVLKGYPDGTYKPSQNINLVEASKIIVNAIGGDFEEPEERWFENYIKYMEQEHAIPTSIDAAGQKISRGEMAEMVWRINEQDTSKPTKTLEALVAPLPSISSCGELYEKYQLMEYRQHGRFGDYGLEVFAEETAVPEAIPAPAKSDLGASSVEASSTNVQVEGVDEADIVKNDNEYIYIAKGDTVRIVKAYPPEDLEEVNSITFEDENFDPAELYLDNDKLTVIGDSYDDKYNPLTKIYIYDVSNKDALTEDRVVAFEGNYSTSRKVDDKVYLVMNKYVYIRDGYNEGEDLLPKYSDTSYGDDLSVVGCGDIRFFPRYETMDYLVVASVSLTDPELAIEKEVLMGAGENVYSSRENMYVAKTIHDYDEQVIYDIWGPIEISTSTMLYRFALNNGDVAYVNNADVPGVVNNQFSMDEHEGYFRLMTTEGHTWDNSAKNNLFILDIADENSDMVLAGEILDIAPGEEIYSARFMGDRAYMVTFKKVDPFFVLDVADPKNPSILGALKIPGYSDYLHPYDENHIIGIGKDTVSPTPEELEQGWTDFVWYQGIKLAMFDVTDVSNPIEMFKEVLGDRGTDSELLTNHKALLFDKEKGILAFPVAIAEIEGKEDMDYTGSEHGEMVFQGAYVYDVDLENGFQFRGKVTHYTDEDMLERSSYWYRSAPKDIQRILYIGDYFYTVSMAMVKANLMSDVSDVSEIEFEVDEDPLPIPVEEEAVPDDV